MALPTLSFGVDQSEINRIRKELGKIQALADPSIRGASAGSVVRYALNRTGTVARKILRNSTPTASGNLRRSVRGRIFKTGNGLSYRAGWSKRSIERFQKPLAIEFGSRGMPARRIVSKSLEKSAGANGKKLIKIFLDRMKSRTAALSVKANSKFKKSRL